MTKNFMNSVRRHKGIILIKSSLGKQWRLKNTITKYFNDELVKAIYSSTPDCNIAYLAIGTGTTPPTRNDTALETEVFRCQVNSCDKSDYGQVLSDFTILDADYAGAISEVGIFGGSGATSTPGSGLLLARVLWNYTKLSTEELYFQRLDTIL